MRRADFGLIFRGGLTVAGVLALLGLAAGFIHWQLHRQHAFTAADFEKATGHPLPASARILQGESLDWDFRGDHDACALIELSPQDYERLRKALPAGGASGAARGNASCSEAMHAAFARYTVLAAESASVEGGSFRYWALAAGQPVVMVKFSSW